MAADLDARSVQTLLRCVQSGLDRFPTSKTLEAFCAQYQDIGWQKGKTIYLSAEDREKIRAILRSEGIDPETPAAAWSGLSRTEALALGNNEKLARDPVKRRRVAVKALRPTEILWIGGEALRLPARAHLEVDYTAVDVSPHDWIVVVENWEAFCDIHLAAERLLFPGSTPLVVWRGDASVSRADAMLAWVERLSQPVAAFVDYDPEGLVIARSLPRLQKIVAPPADELARLLGAGVRDRYLVQLQHCQKSLDAMRDLVVKPLWEIIRREGRALPQETFLSAA